MLFYLIFTVYFEGSSIVFFFPDDKIYMNVIQAYQTRKGFTTYGSLSAPFPTQDC